MQATKTKLFTKKIDWPELEAVLYSDENAGFCLNCGAEACSGIEPDAERYPCEACEENAVFGAQQILFMGAYNDD